MRAARAGAAAAQEARGPDAASRGAERAQGPCGVGSFGPAYRQWRHRSRRAVSVRRARNMAAADRRRRCRTATWPPNYERTGDASDRGGGEGVVCRVDRASGDSMEVASSSRLCVRAHDGAILTQVSAEAGPDEARGRGDECDALPIFGDAVRGRRPSHRALLSSSMIRAMFDALGLPCANDTVDVADATGMGRVVMELRCGERNGLNVTVPQKRTALAQADTAGAEDDPTWRDECAAARSLPDMSARRTATRRRSCASLSRCSARRWALVCHAPDPDKRSTPP